MNFLRCLYNEKDLVYGLIKLQKEFFMKKRVRAVIVQNDLVLLIHRVKGDNEYWVFPGGGLEEADLSPQEGLKRECMEELGVDVEVGDLLIEEVCDFSNEKQIELFYCCRIVGGKIGTGKGPEFTRDPKQSGTYDPQWLSVHDLAIKNVHPVKVREKVIAARR